MGVRTPRLAQIGREWSRRHGDARRGFVTGGNRDWRCGTKIRGEIKQETVKPRQSQGACAILDGAVAGNRVCCSRDFNCEQ